jgi:hypothetical protein
MTLGLIPLPPAGEVAAALRRRVGARAALCAHLFPLPIPPPQAGEGGACGSHATRYDLGGFQGRDKK